MSADIMQDSVEGPDRLTDELPKSPTVFGWQQAEARFLLMQSLGMLAALGGHDC